MNESLSKTEENHLDPFLLSQVATILHPERALLEGGGCLLSGRENQL